MIYNWKTIVKSSLPILTIAVVIEIFAGQILQSSQETILILPIFLISIPVINGIGGNIGSILGARLASGLHIGSITYQLTDKEMHKNLITAVLLGLLTFFILAILIYYIAFFGGIQMGISLAQFVSIVLGAGFFLVLVISMVSVFTAFWSFKKGLDPDNMVAPVVTTLGDTLGIILLFLFIGAVGV